MSDISDLLDFPCEYVLKIMGKHNDEFELAVFSIVKKHFNDIAESAIKSRPSKNNNYVSISITVTLDSAKQLKAVYKELYECKHVVMTL